MNFIRILRITELKCEFHTDHSSYIIYADGALIARAFENLIGNAIKYGRTGKLIKIDISGTKSTVKIAVTNYGNVIPPEDIPFVFDQFYRVDASRRRHRRHRTRFFPLQKQLLKTSRTYSCQKLAFRHRF